MPQDASKRTRAPSLRKSDGLIDWTRPADFLDRFIRAMTPWPGAFTFWRAGEREPLRLVVHEAEAEPGAEPPSGLPGRIASLEHGRISIQTGRGLLHVLRLQPAGKRPMPAADFLLGHDLAVGDLLGDACGGGD